MFRTASGSSYIVGFERRDMKAAIWIGWRHNKQCRKHTLSPVCVKQYDGRSGTPMMSGFIGKRLGV